VTPAEVARAKAQLHARLVFDNDSVTNIAHQLGYFETIGGAEEYASLEPRLAKVTADAVSQAAARCLPASNRTVGWFDPTGQPAEASAKAGDRS
jgi:predicted Zn-dependent peptidase